jgi:peptidoglycan/LPS O-acetylase OafA/YrhL
MLASAGRTSSHRRVFNGSGRVGEFLSHHSYAVYIIHSPVIVALAVALREHRAGKYAQIRPGGSILLVLD